MSELFLQTLREAPGEARSPGYQRLLRGGFVRAVGTGSHVFLPLGVRLRRRVEQSIVDALRPLGAQPLALPDAAEAEHHATLLAAASGVVQSYRQLPCLLYEPRQVRFDGDRGAGGLLGAGMGLVLDAYSLHADAGDLVAFHEQVHVALARVMERLAPGLVHATHGLTWAGRPAQMAGLTAHQWLQPHPEGSEPVARCGACGYTERQASAPVRIAPPPAETPGPLREVETPNCKTIAELAGFLGIPESRTAKALFLTAARQGEAEHFVLAVVRGDTALNEGKLLAALAADAVAPASEEQIRRAGAEPGYGSPLGLEGVTVVVDDLVTASPNLVAGANRPGYHALNVNYGRDYRASIVADIAMVQEGSPCPACGDGLVIENGVEIGRTGFAGQPPRGAPLPCYLDREGRTQPVLLARYRVWTDRLIAALAESRFDDHGIVWPVSAAPYDVHLMTLGKASAELLAAAERLYADLAQAGFDVLFDDRDERAGVKFNDADLLGAPVRVAVGDRGLKDGSVEIKGRAQVEVRAVPIAEVTAHIAEALSAAA